MSGDVRIDQVTGFVYADGTVERIEIVGTAEGTDAVTVAIRCAASALTRSVPVMGGRFRVILDAAGVRGAECRCGGEVEVTASASGSRASTTWSGVLECRPVDEPDGGTRPVEPIHPVTHCTSQPGALLGCGAPTAHHGPQHVVPFTQVLPLVAVPLADHIDVVRPDPRLGAMSVPLVDANKTPTLHVQLVARLMIEQRWFFQALEVHDLVATVPLAPHETLRLSVRTTQRKQLTQKTIDSVEQLDARESTLVDRDVLNVARSMSTTENWHVDGTGSFSIGGFGASVSAGYAKSVNHAVQTSTQQLRESTQKSASTLKTLRTTEVTELGEETAEQRSSRLLVNPYFDRSLLIKIFDQVKVYCVETAFTSVDPAVVVTVDTLPFDEAFVLRYGDFLAVELLDKALSLQLADALDAVHELRDQSAVAKAVDVADLALLKLFGDSTQMFNIPAFPPLPAGVNPNDPRNSFDANLERNGLDDAVGNKLGVIYTALGYFQQIYAERVEGRPPTEFGVDLAVALERFVGPLWLAIEDPDVIKNILDRYNLTEVFRRLSGFIALVSGMLTPLVAPVEAQRAEQLQVRKARHVLGRTVDHLVENGRYYTQRFLEYLVATARHDLFAGFVAGTLRASTLQGFDQIIPLLDLSAAYVDEARIVVPARSGADTSALLPLAGLAADPPGETVTHEVFFADQVEVPCDGAYFEAVAGQCILDAVPERHTVALESAELVAPSGTS